MNSSTVCAPATPPLNSAVSIVRITGPDSLRAVTSLMEKNTFIEPRVARYATLWNEGEIIDDVIMIYYKSPKSFTGEDMVELFCHGNPLIVQKLLRLLGRSGIELAGPGEFSKRAFLNGKIDLTAAEAINHIITARSDWDIQASLRQMHGSLKGVIASMKERVIRLKADVELGIDFIEEDVDIITQEQALAIVDKIDNDINSLIDRCSLGRKMSHGIDVAIVGKPNAGKSSILNAILNQERAIVSDEPGTTRDLIRETIQIRGVPFNLIDTAGIGTSGEKIELIGMELSRKKIESASIILLVLDAACGITDEDSSLLSLMEGKNYLPVINKIDLIPDEDAERINGMLPRPGIKISALLGSGFAALEEKIYSMVTHDEISIEPLFVADIRIMDLLDRAKDILGIIRALFLAEEPDEIIACEIQNIIECLSAITGEVTPEDILDSIFSRFCIGK